MTDAERTLLLLVAATVRDHIDTRPARTRSIDDLMDKVQNDARHAVDLLNDAMNPKPKEPPK